MTNKPSTDNATRFLAMNPTLIGRVGEIDFYEHPLRGDESPTGRHHEGLPQEANRVLRTPERRGARRSHLERLRKTP